MKNTAICHWCEGDHDARFLCDAAKQILDAFYAKGMEGNMPTIEFPKPIPAEQLNAAMGVGPEDRLLSQLVVQAGTVPVAGVQRPVLVFTGRTLSGLLPRWYYPGTTQDIERTRDLVRDMADLAIRRAKAGR